MAYAGEYTPEISEDLISSLGKRYEQNKNASLGRLRGMALNRGLEGDPFEAQGTAAIESQYGQNLGDLYSQLAYDIAGRKRGERLTDEARKYGTSEREASQAYQAEQNRLARNWEEQMMPIRYRLQQDLYESQQPGLGEMLGGAGLNVLSSAGGYGLGRGFAKLIGA